MKPRLAPETKSYLNLNKLAKKIKNKGFTLIEMIVATGIIAVVLATVLASYPKMTDTINLQRGVQLLALNIRRAQVYGITVKENPTGSGEFPAYGIHFDFDDAGLSNKAYILFADSFPSAVPPEETPGNSQYDPGLGENLATEQVPSPGYIFQLCSNQKTGDTADCPANCNLKKMDIVFRRPAPDIYLSGSPPVVTGCNDVEIRIKSPRGFQKQVVIWRTGQISVEN